MSGYTKKNLKEVEDSAPKFGLSPDLEARFARKDLEGVSLGLSYQRIAPNFRVPFGHRHRDQEEVYVLLSGTARLRLDDDVIDLEPWDAVRIDSTTMRGLQAGPHGAELLAFGAGTDPGDAELLQGWWTG